MTNNLLTPDRIEAGKGKEEEVLKALSENDTTQERLLAALKARIEKEEEA